MWAGPAGGPAPLDRLGQGIGNDVTPNLMLPSVGVGGFRPTGVESGPYVTQLPMYVPGMDRKPRNADGS